jgi:hypothetical protein
MALLRLLPSTLLSSAQWLCAGCSLLPLLLATVVVSLMLLRPVQAQQEIVSREYAIKANIIGVLGKCVTWPTESAPKRGEPLTIGVLGQDPFIENGVNQLDLWAAAEKRKGREVVVKRFDSASGFVPCHILFVSNQGTEKSAEKTLAERAAAAKKLTAEKAVLVVGEASGLTREGATASLAYDRLTNVIQLEINPDAAARADLKLAPDLLRLKLVRIVRDAKE